MPLNCPYVRPAVGVFPDNKNCSKKNALFLGAHLRSIRASKQQRNKAFYEEKFTGEGT